MTASLRASVVVMTMNRPGPLRRCLDSLAAQTMPVDAFEVILVDASDGPVGDVADAYRDRLGLVHHPTPNLGVSAQPEHRRQAGPRPRRCLPRRRLRGRLGAEDRDLVDRWRLAGGSLVSCPDASSVTSIVRRSPGSSVSTSTTAAAPGATTGSALGPGAGR